MIGSHFGFQGYFLKKTRKCQKSGPKVFMICSLEVLLGWIWNLLFIRDSNVLNAQDKSFLLFVHASSIVMYLFDSKWWWSLYLLRDVIKFAE